MLIGASIFNVGIMHNPNYIKSVNSPIFFFVEKVLAIAYGCVNSPSIMYIEEISQAQQRPSLFQMFDE